MKKHTFDAHIEGHYGALLRRSKRKHGEAGEDILHDALLALYRAEYYKKLPEKTSSGRIYGGLCKAADYALIMLFRKIHGERVLIDPLQWHEEEEGTMVIEPIVELQTDVRLALGRLSALQYNLVHACLIEGSTLREVAVRTGHSLYFIFTELEIAKACLRTDLDAYRNWR